MLNKTVKNEWDLIEKESLDKYLNTDKIQLPPVITFGQGLRFHWALYYTVCQNKENVRCNGVIDFIFSILLCYGYGYGYYIQWEISISTCNY